MSDEGVLIGDVKPFLVGTAAGRTTVMAGVKAGAIVGCLLWFTADMMLYAVTNVGNLRTMLLGPVVELIPALLREG